MKVVHIGKYYPPAIGGVESHVRDLAEGLAVRGIDCGVIVSSESYRDRRFFIKGVHVTRLSRLFTVFSQPVCFGLVKELRNTKADIVHLHLPNPIAALSYLIARPAGRLVVTWHSDVVRQRLLYSLLRIFHETLLRRADAIIVTSPNYLETSKDLLRFRKKCHVIPLGVDIFRDKINEIHEIKRRPVVLFVGRLVYYKGVEYLIEAMRGVDADLWIVGDGPERRRLDKIARDLKNVRFLGSVKDTSSYFSSCDIFVLPSVERSEAFGMVLLEAMAHGKPVISTALGTGVEYVNLKCKTGFVVPPRDSFVLRKAILDLCKDNSLKQRMGRNARRRAEMEFSLDRMIDRTLKLYREILGGKHR